MSGKQFYSEQIRSKNAHAEDSDFFLVYLLVCAHPLKEWLEGGETVIVSGIAKLLHQSFGLLLGQLLTEIGEQPEELVLKDGAVLVFVVQLQDFNEVVEATSVLGVLGLLEDWVELINLDHSLALLRLSTEFSDGLQSWIQVACSQEVADVKSINLAITLEVINLKGKLDLFNITWVDAVLFT